MDGGEACLGRLAVELGEVLGALLDFLQRVARVLGEGLRPGVAPVHLEAAVHGGGGQQGALELQRGVVGLGELDQVLAGVRERLLLLGRGPGVYRRFSEDHLRRRIPVLEAPHRGQNNPQLCVNDSV